MHESHDRILLHQFIREGSTAARDELIQRHLPVVHALALREVADTSVALDIAQAVFLIFLRKAPSLSENTQLGGWFFKVVRYVAADFRKMESRRRRHETEAHDMRAAMATSHSPSVNDIRLELNNALARLGAKDRDVLIQKYMSGMSNHEIAAALAIPEGTLRQRLARALQRLKVKLNATDDTLLGSALALGNQTMTPTQMQQMLLAILMSDPQSRATTLARLATRRMFMFKLKIATAFTALIGLLFITIVSLNSAGARQVATSATLPTATDLPQLSPPAHGPAADPSDTVKHAYAACAAGDPTGFMGCFDNLSPSDRTFMTQLTHILTAACKLHKATAERFGTPGADDLFATFNMGVTDADVANCTQAITGDTARVILNKQIPGVPLIRQNGLWKISRTILDHINGDVINSQDSKVPEIDRLTAKISAGDYPTIAALKHDLMSLMASGQ